MQMPKYIFLLKGYPFPQNAIHQVNPPSRSSLKTCHSRRPPLAYPLHVIRKLPTRNLLAPPPPQRRMLIRVIERILQQPDIGILHSLEHRLQLRIPHADGNAGSASVDAPTSHVHDAD